MKTKYWITLFAVLAVVCLGASVLLLGGGGAAQAEVYSGGTLVKNVDLAIDQEFSVGGHNTVTVKDGKIAVTWADCPDGYCMERGFRDGGTDIVCLPNRLVIHFTGAQEVDGAVG